MALSLMCSIDKSMGVSGTISSIRCFLKSSLTCSTLSIPFISPLSEIPIKLTSGQIRQKRLDMFYKNVINL